MTEPKTYRIHFTLPNDTRVTVRVETRLAIGTPSAVDLVGRRLDSFGVHLRYIEQGTAPGGQFLSVLQFLAYAEALAAI